MLSDIEELFAHNGVVQGADRRVTRRIIDAWARAARGRFPSWAALRARPLGGDENWMFAVDLTKSTGFPYFTYVGEKLSKLSDVYLSGEEDWTMSLMEKATEDIFAAASLEGPHERSDTLVLCDGRRVLFRSVTVPLADDGEEVTHIAGVVYGRFATSGRPSLVAVENRNLDATEI